MAKPTNLTKHTGPPAVPAAASHPGSRHGNNGQVAEKPAWDANRRELRLGKIVLKHFVRPAPLLETIVAAFQEDDWSRRIDDPLSPSNGIDPKRRLHDAIKDLNASQFPHLIRFYGDGTGAGICWEHMRQ